MTILQHSIAQAAAAGGYQIARSLRFNSADTAYLNRTPSSAGNRKTWTLVTWVKISEIANFNGGCIFGAGQNGAVLRVFGSGSATSQMEWYDFNGSSFSLAVTSTRLLRDPTAWCMVTFAFDTTQATSSNRLKIYIDNNQVAFSSASYPSLNYDGFVNNATEHLIGRVSTAIGGLSYGGYMADFRFIDGQALDPTSFGQTDANTGVWVPKTYTGTYGTNGFWLKFDDNSGVTATTLGKDSSGNSNNWTPNNFSVTAGVGNDSLVDTPTNYGTDTGAGGEVRGNYCTLNPLDRGSDVTLVNGNLDASWAGVSGHSVRSTLGITSGKWYWEVVSGGNTSVGLIRSDLKIVPATGSAWVGADGFGAGGSYAYAQDGRVVTNSTYTAYGASVASGDVLGVAFDADNGKIYFSKNGTWQNSGNPATSTNPAFTGIASNTWSPAIGYWGGTAGTTNTFNFGQRPFAYTAPSGFKALCTQNLPTPAIGATSSTLASKNMNVVTWTGTSSGGGSVTGVGFQPDLVWVKNRGAAAWNHLVDVLRTPPNTIFSNATNAETTPTNGNISAINSDGFSYAAGPDFNSASLVGWTWKAGGTGVSNTSGSITSTVSANTAAGISVVTYTGTGTAATIGHGLGVAPKMLIIKSRSDAATSWIVYHSSISPSNLVTLQTSSAKQALPLYFNSTATTSTVFSIGSAANTGSDLNVSTKNYVAYAFAEIAGFSKFSSYIGNGSADGPFVYCGFRPRFVMIKNSSNSANWTIVDTSRNTYNVANSRLFPSLSDAETSSTNNCDILSNGFKIRIDGATDNGANTNGDTYIFAAFAEAPFQYSRAR